MDDELYALKKRVEELESEVERWASRTMIEFNKTRAGTWNARVADTPLLISASGKTPLAAFVALLRLEAMEGLR